MYTLLELQENPDFIFLVSSLLGDGNDIPDPTIMDLNFTCLAQGPTQGLYRATSIVVEFRPNPGDDVTTRQCQFLCFDDEWRTPSSDDFENLVGSPPTRYDCSNCREANGPNHNCIGE